MTRQLAKIIADSMGPHGVRLTTMEIQLPRIVLAEFNTHRVFARNSASSRAIPIDKMLARVIDDPYVPEDWDRNGSGMQGHGPLTGDDAEAATTAWEGGLDAAVEVAEQLRDAGAHKQWSNRVLEPYLWHTIIVTATEWENFFALRCHPAAHPAIRDTAEAMREAMDASTPRRLQFGEWHLPYSDARDDDLSTSARVKVAVARCARVSYLTHDGVRDPSKDVELHDRLLESRHMSPFEHVARPASAHDIKERLDELAGVTVDPRKVDPAEHFIGNFRGWVQHRKTIAGESGATSTGRGAR